MSMTTNKQELIRPRAKRYLEAFGEKHTIGQWSRMLGIPYQTIRTRQDRGFSPEDCLTFECFPKFINIRSNSPQQGAAQ